MDVEGGVGLLGDRLEVGVGLVLGALAEHRVEETSEALEPVRVVGQLEFSAKKEQVIFTQSLFFPK